MRCMGCMREYSQNDSICPICGYDQNSPVKHSNHLKPGTMVAGRYLIGRALGSGGFGITYIAWDSLIGRTVAIKEYLPGVFAYRVPGQNNVDCYNKESAEKFRAGVLKTMDESNTLARFNSLEGVVDVYNCVEANGTVYIVMEYLEGKSLKEELITHGKYSFVEAMGIMTPILNALYQIHESGIIHRDISPDNIFVCNDGTVRLIDFGAARMAINDNRKSLSVILKRGYAPKEQYSANAKQGPWTDVYATAATFYRMITGVVPQESLERDISDTLLPPSKLGVELPDYAEHAIMRALEIDTTKRTKNTFDFFRQLTEPELDFTIEESATYADFEPVKNKPEDRDFKKNKKESKFNKKLFTLTLVSILIIVAATVTAVFLISGRTKIVDSGTCGENLSWKLDSKGVITISGTGLMDDYANYSDTPWYNNINEISIVMIDNGVESIGSRAFYSCKSLAKTEFGSSLNSIGSYAFYGCSSLENCVLPDSLISIGSYSFSHCKSLEYLHIPKSVTHFGVSILNSSPAVICSDSPNCDARAYAETAAIQFSECDASHKENNEIEAQTLIKPENESNISTENIVASGFCGTTATWVYTKDNQLIISGSGKMDGWILDEETAYWPADNYPEWRDYAREVTSIVVEDGILDIGNSAFTNFTALEDVILPDGLDAIGSNAFMGCSSLKSISAPSSVTIIGDGAFKDCVSLVTANISCAVMQIGQYSFSGCKALRIVTLPQMLAEIGDYAFADCASLSQIAIPQTVTAIGEYSFRSCSMLKALTFAYGLEIIPKGAFSDSGLTTFDIPSSVTTIGEYAFNGCSSLTNVNIPNSVKTIGKYAFGGCSSLTGVIIPSSVTVLGAYAFSNCTALEYVHIPASVTSIGTDILENSPAVICSDSIISSASNYAMRKNIVFRRCGNQH